MTDYNISDHWAADEPVWIKSLVSSLERRHNRSTILPLTLAVDEIASWVELASGVDAWKSRPNRDSLRADLDESVAALGGALHGHLAGTLEHFDSALNSLLTSPPSVLEQAPGMRTHRVWTDLAAAVGDLLIVIETDAAVGACFDDLVAAAQDRSAVGKEYRAIADLLFDQLARRGLEAKWVFSQLVAMLAYGQSPEDSPLVRNDLDLSDRVARARAIACTPADIEPVVVWLGYEGRGPWRTQAGHVTFLDAHWAVSNASPDGQQFDHKDELRELVDRGGLFKVADMVDEKSDVDSLVRVDLGETTAAGAVDRAIDVVNIVLDVVIHRSGGARPHLAQYGILQSGRAGASSFMVGRREPGFPDDRYGASVTANAIHEHAPRIADALARQELPRFLAAAIEAQATADHPFGRDMALREPSEADIRSVIPLSDQVVQNVAAHAAITPGDAFTLLSDRWPHARWLTDVQRAVQLCLVGGVGGPHNELRHELTAGFYSPRTDYPWILFVADRSADLLSTCVLESERAWIERTFRSISDHAVYAELIDVYEAEERVLAGRRRRVRNALVHGNPVKFPVVASVREYSEFLSGSALQLALEAYIDGTPPINALQQRSAEYVGMASGVDAAAYWLSLLRADHYP